MSAPAIKINSPILTPGRRYDGTVLGPVKDLFFGNVVEINLLGNGARVCSFNCSYCDLSAGQMRMNQIKRDFQFVSPEKVSEDLKNYLNHWKATWPTPEAIIISGNGEPMLHPQIDDVVEKVSQLRDELRPGTPVVLFTNGAHLTTARPIRATKFANEVVLKVDAGNDMALKAMNAPLVRVSLNKLINSFKKVKDITIQSMFVGGDFTNTDNKNLEEWIEVIGMVGPKKVYIYTLSYTPTGSGILPLSEDDLHVISSKLERRTGIASSVFVG